MSEEEKVRKKGISLNSYGFICIIISLFISWVAITQQSEILKWATIITMAFGAFFVYINTYIEPKYY